MLLERVVSCSAEMASTRSRTAKVATLSALLRELGPNEVAPAVGFLSGIARQGRIGLGWASAATFMSSAAATAPTLTIEDIDLAMAEIQMTIGQGSAVKRAAIIKKMTDVATAQEADFIARLLVGELRQGALAGVMIEAIAKASEIGIDIVRRAWMLSGDLNETARIALVEGPEALVAIGLTLFTPVHPMLASGAVDPTEAISGYPMASVESKLDGIRIQVHRSDDEVRVYTRNLNDITDRVSDVVALVRAMPSSRLILDGELIDAPYFFDCLHHDGRDLIDLPLSERLKVLESIAREHRVPSIITDEPGKAERFLEGALDAGYEGIVVKDLASTYQAGRRGKVWRKVKRAKTFDLVVLGAEWGSGRRRGWLSNLHLGARTEEGGFVMVGKTFKGLTDELLRWQTDRLKEMQTHGDEYTVYVRPELVVEIALDGVMESTRYPGGVGLRFARVIRYREDKDPSEADSVASLRAAM